MNRTRIPWCDYTLNPIKGLCPVACSYCYARAMYRRFRWQEKVRWHPPAWDLVDTLKKPSRIFVGSTFELFHPSLPENWMEYNLLTAKKYPQHTFIFLTKQPQNLPREWPDNCWVGVSVTSNADMTLALTNLANIKAPARFLSIEPLLGDLGMNDHMSIKGIVDWLIIGEQTRPTIRPRREWVDEIIDAADKCGIPVFVKPPLSDIMNIQRREFPKTRSDNATINVEAIESKKTGKPT